MPYTLISFCTLKAKKQFFDAPRMLIQLNIASFCVNKFTIKLVIPQMVELFQMINCFNQKECLES